MDDEAFDRRTDVTLRNAVVRLRLAENRVLEYPHEVDALELTASIDALVAVLRRQGVLK